MAITVTSDQTLVNTTGGDAEVITNWTVAAAWSTAPVTDGDMYLQSTTALSCIGGRASGGGTATMFWDHLTTGATLDLTTGNHVFFWIKCITIPAMDARVRGAIGLSLSSGTDVTTLSGTVPWNGIGVSKQWFLTGNDVDTTSGWVCYVVDPTSVANLTIGSANMAAVVRAGIRVNVINGVGAGSFKPKNILWDAIRYGTKLTITGSTGTFEDIYTADNMTANQYGILRKSSGVYLGGGKLIFGTTGQAAVCTVTDTKQTLVWQDFPVASTFYQIELVGAGSFATTVTLGAYSGGLTSGGCIIKGVGLDSRRLIAPVIVAGGTGYTANDILTVSGGTSTITAQFRVQTVSGGVITAIVMEREGSYSVPPTGTLSVTGGTGSGATFTATVEGGSIWTLTASAANQTLNIYGSTLSEMLSAALVSTTTWRGNTITNSGTITANGTLIDSCTFQDLRTTTPISATYQVDAVTNVPTLTNCKFVNCATALRWPMAFDPNGKLDDTTFISGGTGHAIEFTGAPTSRTLTDVVFSGYSGSSTDAAVYVNTSAGSMTLTCSGTTTDLTGLVRVAAGVTVTVVAGLVTTIVNVKDHNGDNLLDARVLLEASDGTGNFPYYAALGAGAITRSGATVSVAHTSHTMKNDDIVVIRGATQVEYNGPHVISNVSANAYDYTISDTPASPATGTITATGAILSGLTNASGNISRDRSFTLATPVSGRVRKSTASPRYKDFPIAGTISTTAGLSINVQLILDE